MNNKKYISILELLAYLESGDFIYIRRHGKIEVIFTEDNTTVLIIT